MNPEFVRNVWLELTPRRLALMVVILVLAFFAAAIAGGAEYSLFGSAQWLYYGIVVFWGTRNAALSVVGEIRDRTWDLQRLSSLAAGTMTAGKLFGSTIYNWFGGAICLAAMTAWTSAHDGPAAALIDIVYYVAIGLISQATALLASLIAVRRRQSHSRFDIFLYQLVGLVAAVAVFVVWSAADPEGSFLRGKVSNDTVVWWGAPYPAREFLLFSLAIFTAWTLLACYREMRLELKMLNGPFAWLAWLLFLGAYVAGFDAWLSQTEGLPKWDYVALRLGLGATAYVALTYLMVLLEPKDRVLYRWLGSRFGSGRIGSGLANLQAWMTSYFAAVVLAIALIFWIGQHEGSVFRDQLLMVAAIGFFTRDVGVFVLMQVLASRRRGDLAALAVLLSLYVLIPAILHGMGLNAAQPFFYPTPSSPIWLGPLAAWAEAIAVIIMATGRIALGERVVTATV
jgi:hypothetical protein